MTAEELQAQISAMRDSIQAQQEKLDELEKQLDSADELDDIDKPLEIDSCDTVYYVTEAGTISIMYGASTNVPFYNVRHRTFKQLKYAEMYREKTQFIADLLHFKWLYDRDYEPDWGHAQWTITKYDDKYVSVLSAWEQDNCIYFSNKEIAQKCADWLNKKAGII